jgi:hypothetical protein
LGLAVSLLGRPLQHRHAIRAWGWKVFEAPGVEPVFRNKDQAVNYAENRASFRSGEIRILNSSSGLERIIPFSEADRKL